MLAPPFSCPCIPVPCSLSCNNHEPIKKKFYCLEITQSVLFPYSNIKWTTPWSHQDPDFGTCFDFLNGWLDEPNKIMLACNFTFHLLKSLKDIIQFILEILKCFKTNHL